MTSFFPKSPLASLCRLPKPSLVTLCLCLSVISPALCEAQIQLGIDVLEARNFSDIKGQKVGLLTHPAGVNRFGRSTISVLRKGQTRGKFKLVALFGPEHGIYGDEKANVPVPDRKDPRTGLPVYSLYGKFRHPTPEMLRGLDSLIIDLQDIGARSYTYVSCMLYAMESCFEQGVAVIVLDRPNPLGGLKVDGPPLDRQWMSYVGAFRVPYVHGLTIAELARMAKELPGWMNVPPQVQAAGKLTLVPMAGWKRSMLWHQTGLKWIPTSPAIPDPAAAMGYPMTGLGTQLGNFRHGYGTRYPFRLLQYPGKSPEQLMQAFKAKNIPGIDFHVIPFLADGEQPRRALYVLLEDWEQLRPTELSFHMMQLAAQWAEEAGEGNPFANAPENLASLFNKHTGSTEWWKALTSKGGKIDIRPFIEKWSRQASVFQEQTRPFWIYRE